MGGPVPDARAPRESLLAAARAGDDAALGQLVGELRPELVALVGRLLREHQADKADPSDVVQQGLLAACEGFDRFQGQSVEEFQGWLAAILHNKTLDAVRYWHRECRDVNREQPIAPDDARGMEPADGGSTPSGRLARQEEAARVVACVDELPGDEREAVRLRHLENWPLARIAERLGRTPLGVAGLLKRGIERLRKRFEEAKEESHRERPKPG